MCAIEEHIQVTVLCEANNQYAHYFLLLFYYLYSPMIDIALYLAIYIDKNIFFLNYFLKFLTFTLILFLFLVSLTTAWVKKSAHFSNKNLNSIIAKKMRFLLRRRSKSLISQKNQLVLKLRFIVTIFSHSIIINFICISQEFLVISFFC